MPDRSGTVNLDIWDYSKLEQSALTITAPSQGFISLTHWKSTYPAPSVDAPSIMSLSVFLLSKGVRLICSSIVFLTVLYSWSITSVHMNFPLTAVAFLMRGISSATVGFHLDKLDSIPENTSQSCLFLGFLSSSKAFFYPLVWWKSALHF